MEDYGVARGYQSDSYLSGDYPGKTLGLISFILSLANVLFIPTAIVGVIMGHVALSQSKAAGRSNMLALIGIIVGWVFVCIGAFLAFLVAFSLVGISLFTG